MGSSLLRGAAQGLTFGFGDEVRGLQAASGFPEVLPGAEIVGGLRLGAERIAPETFGHSAHDRYNQQVAQARAENDSAQQTNPGSYFAGELAGGVAQLPMAPVLAPFKVAEGAKLASQAAAGLGNLAANGAIYGAVSGAGNSQGGLGARAGDALAGAATGAVLNPVLGTVANAAGGTARGALRYGRNLYEANHDPEALAARMVESQMARDGKTPSDYIEAMTEPPLPAADPSTGVEIPTLGPRRPASVPITAADVAGPHSNLQGMAGQIVRTPGKGFASGRELLEGRQFGSENQPSQEERVKQNVSDLLGGDDSGAIQSSLIDNSRALANQFYERSFQDDAPMISPELMQLAARPSVARAISDANRIASEQGTPLPTMAISPAGAAVPSPAADTYLADSRQRMDAALGDAFGNAGPLGREDQIVAQRAAAANPLYEAWRASSVPTNDDLADLLRRPSIRAALPRAERMARDEGKTILAEGSGKLEPEPYGPDTLPEPPDMPEAPVPGDDAAVRPVKPDVPRPQSLIGFLQKAGGVRDTGGDLRSAGLNVHPGLLRTNGGMGLDAAREAAAEAGYLGADRDHAMASTTVNDLIDRLTEHPAYSHLDDDAVHAWEAHDGLVSDYNQFGGKPDSASAVPPRAPLSSLDPGESIKRPPLELRPEGWDYVKRAIDDKISKAQRSGANNEARIYTGLKHEVISRINSPEWNRARQAFAGHSDVLDALAAGRKAATPAVDRETVAREFGALGTDSERDAYRLGYGATKREQLAKAGDGGDFAHRVIGNQADRDKIGIIAAPDAAARLHGAVSDEARAFDTALTPNRRGWHMALQQIDQRLAKMTDKVTGELPEGEAHDIKASRDALAAILGRDPVYANGARFDAPVAELQGAVVRGRAALSRSADQIRTDLARLSPTGQEAYRLGLAQSMRESLGDRQVDKRKVLAATSNQIERIRAAAPDEASFNRFMAAMQRERQMFDTRAQIGGSPTSERGEVGRDTTENLSRAHEAMHLGHALLHGNFAGAYMIAARHLSKLEPKMRERVLQEASKFILTPSPNAMRALEARLAAMSVPVGPRQAFLGTLRKLVSGSTAVVPRVAAGYGAQGAAGLDPRRAAQTGN